MRDPEMAELLKLHVGCGKRFIPDFVHVDQVAFAHTDHVQDIRRLANFSDNSASLIYACQVIEYFDCDEVIGVLNDWRRVLAPGGTLRLSVPNFAVICKLYHSGVTLDNFLGTLFGRMPDGENGFVYHRTTYDETSLHELLGKLGFIEIGLWDWRQTEHADIDDFSQAYFPHMDKEHGTLFNLNMQGKK
jgi:ubiquinone/menaquinone biosynthesis C-methylase UbiE